MCRGNTRQRYNLARGITGDHVEKEGQNCHGGTEATNTNLQKTRMRKAGVLEGDGQILNSKKKGKWVEITKAQTDKVAAIVQTRQPL